MNFDFTEFPVLATERLQLLEITDSHLQDIFEIFGNENVVRYYNVEQLQVLEDAQPIVDWFKLKFNDRKGLRWGIALAGQTKIIGTIGINNFTWGHKGVLGYDLNEAYWSNGYMCEALQTVIEFGFKAFGLARMEAEVMPGNIGSERVLLKTGFEFEGTLRRTLFWNNHWYDMKMFSVLNPDVIV